MGLIIIAILLIHPLGQLRRALRFGVIEGITFEVRRAQAPAAFWANVALAAGLVLGGAGIIGLTVLGWLGL